MSRRFEKVLIANRGEIAVRVQRALRELDIASVAIYSEADREALHVRLADEAYCVGPPPSGSSYLQGERIVELASRIGVDAIHPGYGFLSENARFAERCEQAGIVFIGPSSRAISIMGSKIESRRLMREAGVPVVPGGIEPLADLEEARAASEEIGFPVMLKASAGGGGKGMRLVGSSADLEKAYRAATSEAQSSFGDASVYVEKYVERPRHVEIQVLGDQHGKVVSLGERECSLQRRHQKVVEEAPSPAVSADLRRRMGAAAVRAAEAVDYTSAGTVEFLVAAGGDSPAAGGDSRAGGAEFYFLEMNTRLQVEHPVTELVTGVDLVVAQIEIAQGERLDPGLEGLQPHGHAIEVRLYAEDPYHGFTPSPGRIRALRLPEGPGVRNDCGIEAGSEVTIHYDPMLAKLIVWGKDRPEALRRLRRALGELRVEGIRTTAPLYLGLLEDEDFLAGRLDIGMLDRKLAAGGLRRSPGEDEARRETVSIVGAALAHAKARRRAAQRAAGPLAARRRWRRAGRQESVRGEG
ncbi:MAG TPA: acetyl-CoA carboxylase biotin carboxylase subunit [Thermoanaerobaculia bacterium]|nr:acetyl-CoA carboxylase biotin carboxylase subunit [Thermoanaerobaculia bacterium]